MKTELSKSFDPRDKGRITEDEMTQEIKESFDLFYKQGFNHALSIVLEAKELGLSNEEIIKRYKKQ